MIKHGKKRERKSQRLSHWADSNEPREHTGNIWKIKLCKLIHDMCYAPILRLFSDVNAIFASKMNLYEQVDLYMLSIRLLVCTAAERVLNLIFYSSHCVQHPIELHIVDWNLSKNRKQSTDKYASSLTWKKNIVCTCEFRRNQMNKISGINSVFFSPK